MSDETCSKCGQPIPSWRAATREQPLRQEDRVKAATEATEAFRKGYEAAAARLEIARVLEEG